MILAAIVAMSLVATGCFGGDDDDTTSSERPDDSATTTTLVQPGVTTSTTLAVTTTTVAAEPTRVPGQPLTYVVQSGDVMGTIAAQFGVTVDAIVEANSLDDPNFISVGQELIIPPPEAETATDEATDDTTGGG
jgi:LysM repeat protein